MTSSRSDTTIPIGSSPGDSDLEKAELAKQSPHHFGELYERYLDAVYRYCQRRVGSQQVAEDITASVFERALTRIETFRGTSFRAWLFRIAHNAVTDHYRRRRNVVQWRPEMSGPDIDPSPEDHAIAAEHRARIRQLLNLLTEDQRQVVELRLSGLTGAEIAEATDRSPDAVKMLQYRALERMRSQFSTNQADSESPDD